MSGEKNYKLSLKIKKQLLSSVKPCQKEKKLFSGRESYFTKTHVHFCIDKFERIFKIEWENFQILWCQKWKESRVCKEERITSPNNVVRQCRYSHIRGQLLIKKKINGKFHTYQIPPKIKNTFKYLNIWYSS